MFGTIKQIMRDKGFGFIVPDDGSDEVFFHRSRMAPKVEFRGSARGRRGRVPGTATAKRAAGLQLEAAVVECRALAFAVVAGRDSIPPRRFDGRRERGTGEPTTETRAPWSVRTPAPSCCGGPPACPGARSRCLSLSGALVAAPWLDFSLFPSPGSRSSRCCGRSTARTPP